MTITAEQEKALEYHPVTMVREDLSDLPQFPLPAGYRLRPYCRGEDQVWAEIETSVGEFPTVERAMAHFEKEFGPHRDEMESRCLFLEDGAGQALGTTTAWYNGDFHGRDYGRIHWVGIVPEYQGKKLAKPLMAAALERLAQSHQRAYLTTQTTSARAIRLYLDLDFVPLLVTDRCPKAWRLLAGVLEHPTLEAFAAQEGL